MPGRDPNALLLSVPHGGPSTPHHTSDPNSDWRSRWGFAISGRPSPSYGEISVASMSNVRAFSPTADATQDDGPSHTQDGYFSVRAHRSQGALSLGPPSDRNVCELTFQIVATRLYFFFILFSSFLLNNYTNHYLLTRIYVFLPARRVPSQPSNSPVTYSDTGESIRDDTALLSDMLLSPAPSLLPAHQYHSFTDRVTATGTSFPRRPPSRTAIGVSTSFSHGQETPSVPGSPKVTISRGGTPVLGEVTPKILSPNTTNRSALTMLLAREARERADSAASTDTVRPPTPSRQVLPIASPPHIAETFDGHHASTTPSSLRRTVPLLFTDPPSRESISSSLPTLTLLPRKGSYLMRKRAW
ncbi:uncharacterized protein EI90DRAFT_2636324 [Cantharellus anzutake]|uniref:uncharacterized protein n=1 Tax=Cantharellus anzutake TaxID=1750568 RepID=UPI001904C17B|nr:uncharacterized protein EI90DRAFT_2636324 [Cantharellus anzutake]KAF8337346.1 hypothetical protein EI90DRAFT_2636324 [Cantharellus anzutake]